MIPVPFCFTALTSVQSQCDCAPFRLATSGVVITWRSIMAALDAVAVELQKLLANAEPTGPFGCLNYKYGKGMGNYARYHMRYPLGLIRQQFLRKCMLHAPFIFFTIDGLIWWENPGPARYPIATIPDASTSNI